jgi:hypothetical protein
MASTGAEAVLRSLDAILGRPATLEEYLDYNGDNPDEPYEDLPERFCRDVMADDNRQRRLSRRAARKAAREA